MFEPIKDIETLNKKIIETELTFVYFGHPDCSVCHGLKPQINAKFEAFRDDINFLEVNTFEVPEVAGEYSVMTVPVVILFVNGKEYLRQARFVPVQSLYEQVDKIVSGFKASQSI